MNLDIKKLFFYKSLHPEQKDKDVVSLIIRDTTILATTLVFILFILLRFWPYSTIYDFVSEQALKAVPERITELVMKGSPENIKLQEEEILQMRIQKQDSKLIKDQEWKLRLIISASICLNLFAFSTEVLVILNIVLAILTTHERIARLLINRRLKQKNTSIQQIANI